MDHQDSPAAPVRERRFDDDAVDTVVDALEAAGWSVRSSAPHEPAGGLTMSRSGPTDAPPEPTRTTAPRRDLRLDEATTLQVADVVVDGASRIALRADQPMDLTKLELDLLAQFVRHANVVLSRDALLASVWGNEPVTPNAIEALVSKLRHKLEEHGPRLIHTVRGVGYVLRSEPRRSRS